MKRIAISTFAVILAAASGLVGTAVSASSASNKPILIGSIEPSSGPYSGVGIADNNSAKMAVAKINAAGGVLGRKIKVLYGNDGASATTSALLFKKFVSGGAVAILGSGATSATTVALADSMKIPDVGMIDDGGPSIYPNGPTKAPYPWAFSTSMNSYGVGEILGTYAMKHCSNGLYVMHDTTNYGVGGVIGIQTAYTKTLLGNDGISENWTTSSPAAATMDSEIGKVKASGAGCVDVWLDSQDQATFVNEMHSLGDNFTVLGNDDTDSDATFAGLAGANANGVISTDLTNIVKPTAVDRAYTKAYLKEFKIAPTPWGETQYDGVMILAKAIKAAGSTSPTKIKAQLNKITNYVGLTGTLSFTKMVHTTINGPQFSAVAYSTTSKKWSVVK